MLSVLGPSFDWSSHWLMTVRIIHAGIAEKSKIISVSVEDTASISETRAIVECILVSVDRSRSKGK